MNNHSLQYIMNEVFNWEERRRNAVTEHYADTDASVHSLQRKHFPKWQFNVARDIRTVEQVYSQSFNIINARDL